MSTKKTSILLICADRALSLMIESLCDEFAFDYCDNLREGKRAAASIKPDLIIISADMPDGDAAIAELRRWANTPIISITESHDNNVALAAFVAGVDDHVVIPFNGAVFLYRIKAAVRRAVVQEAGEPALMHGPITMDLVRHTVSVRGELTALTPKEYDLLRYFMVNRGMMLTHKQILKAVWGPAHLEDTQYLRVYVSQLREKLGGYHDIGGMIRAESGIGYILENESQASVSARRQTRGPGIAATA